tara:strand:+ start:832 stop:1167 length:336 start_codon:yes stop_codon:yes gene_type:complete
MSTRLFKVQDLLHKEIAMLIHTSIQNPEIKSVTISGVRVSKDLKYSEIYFTTLEKNHEKIESELNKASGFMRNQLSKKIHLKRLPVLRFTYDSTMENSQKIEELIKDFSKN